MSVSSLQYPRPVESVSIIGLGKLGAPLVACSASKGYRVIGVDVNPRAVELVNQGHAPVFEPGLEELLQANRERISATLDTVQAVLDSQITFIIVPTPSEENGAFSLKYVIAACEQIGEALRRKNEYHLVVVTSTVLPGATDNEVKSLLEERSGKKCGVDFGLCYSPEFIALGSVIRDMLHPDFVLIGETSPRAGELLEAFHHSFVETDPPVVRMNAINAEITKLSVNTFVTTKIAFANMLARLCEHTPGADADVVTGALGLDKRIGGKYLKGAVGYGGPCFPRDNKALSFFARQAGASASLAEATDAANRAEAETLALLVRRYLPEGGTIGIMGLSYKPDTDVTEESQGVLLARALLRDGVRVLGYDPAGMANAQRMTNNTPGAQGELQAATSAADCVRRSDVVVIVTAWNEFKQLTAEDFAREGEPRVLIDGWRVLNNEAIRAATKYIPLGAALPCD